MFINSLGCDLRIWTEVAGNSSRPDFRIVSYDKRDHGLSETRSDLNEMADYARDLAALLDVVGVRRATIVGLSIGGMIAQEFYRQGPGTRRRACALRHCGEDRNGLSPGISASLRSSAEESRRLPIRP